MTKKNAKACLKELNETGCRSGKERRCKTESVGKEQRKAKRRRQIDPTTCEREYNESEIEFMHALDEYKRASGRMFPTCSEILEVLIGLGYRQVAEVKEGFEFNEKNSTASDFDSNEDEER